MNNDYIRKRTQCFGMSMMVMGVSFFLYYLGLFGNVEGPLSPGKIGASLAGIGVTKAHALMFFLSFFIIAMTWNHLYNLVSLMMGSRLTCNHKNKEGHICGALTRKIKTGTDKKKGGVRYTCVNGHTCFNAGFRPVKKGSVSHTVWVTALLFCVIILYGA
ncbi:hypothetical protein [Desulfobacula sp.]|uniref:hypothetical protein n=1 Tax=Desulfobacula sp. TaxID=2593537 RepID=UPI0026058F75|nr:hypothetical protein [Desulfobacula sp.]